ncbi:MAG: TlyA family RNA methyltransferase [Armatimonadetes bacterium]|jgi:23S rRNA (cytidine1920-2'-O)/16S rRNA (cytidine1409-2'-O)-methyltransferase|nr:TlyA family RNA methyltransferase [Armatimonadota bacterium]
MRKPERERVDTLLVKQGHCETRERAQAAILAGRVYLEGQRIDKAGTRLPADAPLEVRGDAIPYVGRGGLKLERALDVFGINPAGRVAMDVGASTGGFTDVLLQRGAAHVFAIDVGYGQLAWKLRTDPRVTVRDRTNIRSLRPGDLPQTPDLAVIDVSFISLAKVLPAVRDLLAPQGEIVALVKPQFEAGPGKVGKGGIVRDAAVHREVLRQVTADAARLGYRVAGLTPSPIAGTEGNLEFLIHLVPGQGPAPDIDRVVDEAHATVATP